MELLRAINLLTIFRINLKKPKVTSSSCISFPISSPKPKRLFIHCHTRQRKAAIPHIQEAETSKLATNSVWIGLSINRLTVAASVKSSVCGCSVQPELKLNISNKQGFMSQKTSQMQIQLLIICRGLWPRTKPQNMLLHLSDELLTDLQRNHRFTHVIHN